MAGQGKRLDEALDTVAAGFAALRLYKAQGEADGLGAICAPRMPKKLRHAFCFRPAVRGGYPRAQARRGVDIA